MNINIINIIVEFFDLFGQIMIRHLEDLDLYN